MVRERHGRKCIGVIQEYMMIGDRGYIAWNLDLD